jgi:hypothetical protein
MKRKSPSSNFDHVQDALKKLRTRAQAGAVSQAEISQMVTTIENVCDNILKLSFDVVVVH